MNVTVEGHQHDPAAVFEGEDNQQLLVQTGTIIFEFATSSNSGSWTRGRLAHTVLELPASPLLFSSNIAAIATSAPCSMSYSPPNFRRILSDSDDTVNVVSDEGLLPDEKGDPKLLAAGWAVDKTHAARSLNKIQLEVDLAVFGHCGLMRLAYSLFVAITPRTTVDPGPPPILNP